MGLLLGWEIVYHLGCYFSVSFMMSQFSFMHFLQSWFRMSKRVVQEHNKLCKVSKMSSELGTQSNKDKLYMWRWILCLDSVGTLQTWVYLNVFKMKFRFLNSIGFGWCKVLIEKTENKLMWGKINIEQKMITNFFIRSQ